MTDEHRSWYAIDPGAVLAKLDVEPRQGLTKAEAELRRLRFGPNAIQKIRPRPAWRVLVDQFTSLVIALLAVAATVAWATGDVLEAMAILVVLLINATVGFATEWQAGRALDALRRHARTTTRVRRDGVERTVDAEDLVPGDIIILNAGDRVPADARLLEVARLQVEESALTGESTTVEKAVEAYRWTRLLPNVDRCSTSALESRPDGLLALSSRPGLKLNSVESADWLQLQQRSGPRSNIVSLNLAAG